jgi:mono/diheme cytochrome c family protein
MRATFMIGALALLGCNEDLLNPMADRQPRVQAFSPSEFYADGLAMREPPVGTVPRERVVLNPGLTTGKIMGPKGEAYVTTFPLKVDRTLVDLGRKRFEITCGTCHGPAGDGDSMVARQMSLRPPPNLHQPQYLEKPVGYIYEVITKGFGLMASYQAELNVRERWAVVAYVKALQMSQTAPLTKAPPEVRTQLERQGPEEPAQPTTEPGAAPGRHQEAP